MKWVCTNCGNHFEMETDPRCPSCLRRNGILPEDDLKGKATGPFRWRPVLAVAACLVAGALVFVGVRITARGKPSSSMYGKAPHDFATVAGVVEKSTGLKLEGVFNPVRIPSSVKQLASQWGGDIEKVISELEKRVILAPFSGKEFRFPEDLANDLLQEKGGAASSLEWALLGHSLAGALARPAAVGINRFEPGTRAHSLGLGTYSLMLYEGTPGEEPVRRFSFPGDLSGKDAIVMTGNALMAAVLSEWSLGRVQCLERPLEMILPQERVRSVSDGEARRSSEHMQAALALEPAMSVVKTAAAWQAACLGMHRRAQVLVDQVTSEYEMRFRKSTGETFLNESDIRQVNGLRVMLQIINGEFSDPPEVFGDLPEEYRPLRVFGALVSGKREELQGFLETFHGRDVPEHQYLMILGTLALGEAGWAERILPLADRLSERFSGVKWALELQMKARLLAGHFDGARALVPKIAEGAPSGSAVIAELNQLIDAMEERKKAGQAPPAGEEEVSP